MVRMNNIKKSGNLISMDCFIDNNHSSVPSFSLVFDPLTRKIVSDMTNVDIPYATRITYKYSNIEKEGLPLPQMDCLAYC